MKKHLIICALCALAVLTQSCGSSSNNIETYSSDTGLTILVDATDTTVYNSIYQDFNTNLDAFFKQTGLADLEKGALLTVKIAPIDASGELTLNQVSLGVPKNSDLSGRERELACDPQVILKMLVDEFDHYKTIAQNQEQLYSPIIDVLLKACREMDCDRELLLIFTDGLENSAYLNMYKNKIPTGEDQVANVVDRVDQVLWKEAKQKVAECCPQIVFVLKSMSLDKKAQTKLFYGELCRQLGVNDVQFIDNMSNTITSQE